MVIHMISFVCLRFSEPDHLVVTHTHSHILIVARVMSRLIACEEEEEEERSSSSSQAISHLCGVESCTVCIVGVAGGTPAMIISDSTVEHLADSASGPSGCPHNCEIHSEKERKKAVVTLLCFFPCTCRRRGAIKSDSSQFSTGSG